MRLGALLALLAFASPRGAVAENVSVALGQVQSGSYSVEGRFEVGGSSEAAWNVLTDYEHIQKFVSGMRSSRVKERLADHILLEQTASSRFLLFSRDVHVLLRVRETPFRRIEFEDVSRADFKRYAGSWDMASSPDGLLIRYAVEAEPNFSAPGWIERKVLKKNTQTLLEEVRAEILRRLKLL